MTMPTREEILSVNSDSEAMDMLRRIADALEGCVVVPRKPTQEMFEAWVSINHVNDRQIERFVFRGDYGNWLACYDSLLAAANKENDHD
jgi:transcription termination factor Rho